MAREKDQKEGGEQQLGMVECFVSKKRVPAAETVEVERNGRRVLVHKRFAEAMEKKA